jgi:hypothetical protein
LLSPANSIVTEGRKAKAHSNYMTVKLRVQIVARLRICADLTNANMVDEKKQ